jgi:hypothetical protein
MSRTSGVRHGELEYPKNGLTKQKSLVVACPRLSGISGRYERDVTETGGYESGFTAHLAVLDSCGAHTFSNRLEEVVYALLQTSTHGASCAGNFQRSGCLLRILQSDGTKASQRSTSCAVSLVTVPSKKTQRGPFASSPKGRRRCFFTRSQLFHQPRRPTPAASSTWLSPAGCPNHRTRPSSVLWFSQGSRRRRLRWLLPRRMLPVAGNRVRSGTTRTLEPRSPPTA